MDLSVFFRTKIQADDFRSRIATISEMTYQTGFNLEKALSEQLGLEKKDKFLTLVRDNKVNTTSAAEMKTFLEKIQTAITEIPLVPITLAFEPKEQTLTALIDWCDLNLKKQVIFDITVDRKLLAGATITYNGKFRDFSLKPKFDQIVANVMTKKIAPTTTQQNLGNLHLGR